LGFGDQHKAPLEVRCTVPALAGKGVRACSPELGSPWAFDSLSHLVLLQLLRAASPNSFRQAYELIGYPKNGCGVWREKRTALSNSVNAERQALNGR